MKPRTLMVSLLLSAALLFCSVFASGGADDPLISLHYLQTVFAPRAEQAMGARADTSGASIYSGALSQWQAASAGAASAGFGNAADTARGWMESRYKQDDALNASMGSQLLLLAGAGNVRFSSGAVIDVTLGSEVGTGSSLVPMHRYLVAENTNAQFTVTSRTAVVSCRGAFRSTPSDGIDYNAIASALKALSLFKGTDLGYGQGFELEAQPTRIQALIMLIRLLGEESAALASDAPNPFSDVPGWAERYTAYAYEKGYTNGVGGGLFAPNREATSAMYVEFLLRALGYSSTAQTDLSTAADRAVSAGVISAGEKALLESGPFLRADVAYLSWYALELPLADSRTTLCRKLEDANVFTEADYLGAKAQVPSQRL